MIHLAMIDLMAVWQPAEGREIILNLPATVERPAQQAPDVLGRLEQPTACRSGMDTHSVNTPTKA